MGIKSWIKSGLGIARLEEENKRLQNLVLNHQHFVEAKIRELKEYTRVDADIGYRGSSTVILTGVYRNKAYVHFYDFSNEEFSSVVEYFKSMKKHALIRNIDAPPKFHGTFNL